MAPAGRSYQISLVLAAFLGVYFWPGSAAPSPSIRFQEIAKSAGLDFVLENSPTDRKHDHHCPTAAQQNSGQDG